MALIRATCDECGDVELRSRDLSVWIWESCDLSSMSQYTFKCPVCRMVNLKDSDDKIVDILISAGVRRKGMTITKETVVDVSAPPICVNDQIDFHELLQTEDWMSHLVD